MRPVSGQFKITQGFGSLATGGVVGNPNGTMVQVLVAMYGDYQHDGHAGTDVGCPVGTPVRAARAGTVVLCDWDVNLPGDDSWSASGYFQRFAFYRRFGGRLLVIKVAPNDYDVYAHLSAWKVGYGQQVSEGQLVALSGDSSAGLDGQLGPHLHTERIVDLTYSTGNGLIFGRMDPTSVWGGLAAQGGNITPLAQEDDMATVPQEEWEWAKQVLTALSDNAATKKDLAGVPGAVVTAQVPYKDPVTGADTGQTTSLATMAGYADFQATATRTLLLQGPAGVAAQINAAGIAREVQAELLKLIGGN